MTYRVDQEINEVRCLNYLWKIKIECLNRNFMNDLSFGVNLFIQSIDFNARRNNKFEIRSFIPY